MVVKSGWQQCETWAFWRDVAADGHIVQIYEDDLTLVSSLENYALTGLKAGDSVVVIATAEHLAALNAGLRRQGVDLDSLRACDQIILLDADETLQKFMVNGVPDGRYFMETIDPLILRGRKNGRKVRVFGEMVALLWGRGNNRGTIQLEQLWNNYFETGRLCLLCGYPKSGFKNDAGAGVMHVCSTYSMLVETDAMYPALVQYKNVV